MRRMRITLGGRWWCAAALASWAGEVLASAAGQSGGILDTLIVVLGVVVVVWVLAYTVRCFIRPGERSVEHVKRRILRHEW